MLRNWHRVSVLVAFAPLSRPSPQDDRPRPRLSLREMKSDGSQVESHQMNQLLLSKTRLGRIKSEIERAIHPVMKKFSLEESELFSFPICRWRQTEFLPDQFPKWLFNAISCSVLGDWCLRRYERQQRFNKLHKT